MNWNWPTRSAAFLCVILLVFILAGCEPIYKTRLPKFAEDVKKTVNPTDLQNWALKTLHAHSTDSNAWEMAKEEIPASIRNLNSQGSPFQWANLDSPANNIWLVWGGGFGHWGIRVGSQTFKPDFSDGNYYIEWQPGIYFWHEAK
jgi:hypothetical protein